MHGTSADVRADDDAPRALATHPRSDVAHRRRDVALRVAIVAVVAMGVVLRLRNGVALWSDEAQAVDVARVPLVHLPAALRHDGAPPLWYLLQHVWIRAVGTGVPAMRALSGVLSVATLPVVWLAGHRIDARRVATGLARPGSRTVADVALVLLAASPFAVRYATEVRMYSLVVLLAALAVLAVDRAWERPTARRLAPVALVTALLLYTHYWAFALVAATAAWLGAVVASGPGPDRVAARRLLGALGIGVLAFLPWVPTFLFQLRHTGTPWGAASNPLQGVGAAFAAFGGDVHVVGWALLALGGLGLCARGLDARHLDVDLATRPLVRVEVLVGWGAIAIGLGLGWLTGTAFEGRYAAVAFPVLVLGAAAGVAAFAGRAARVAVVAAVVALGLLSSVEAVTTERTQAVVVAQELAARAHPGDVVAYCPDTLGTDAVRIVRRDVRQVAYPDLAPAGRIDWVDYDARVTSVAPTTFATRLLDLAGPDRTVWLVSAPGVRALAGRCEAAGDALLRARPGGSRVVSPDAAYFEAQGLTRFPPR